MPRPCAVEAHVPSCIAENVRLHGASPWHLKTLVLILFSNNHETPRGKPVASWTFVQSRLSRLIRGRLVARGCVKTKARAHALLPCTLLALAFFDLRPDTRQ
jgi:hypothetical protein